MIPLLYRKVRQRLPTPCNGAVMTEALRWGGGYIVVFANAGTLYIILLQLFTSWYFIKCTYNMLRWWIKERSFRQLKLLGFRSRILQSTKNMFVLWLKILPTAFNSKINIFIKTFLGVFMTAALRWEGVGGYMVLFVTAVTLYKILLQLFTSWHFIKGTYRLFLLSDEDDTLHNGLSTPRVFDKYIHFRVEGSWQNL